MSDAPSLVRDLETVEAQALQDAEQATDTDGLEEVRIRYLGRKDGRISGVLRQLGATTQPQLCFNVFPMGFNGFDT